MADLRPASVGWDLLVKVVRSKVVVDTPSNRVAEALVGDATGVVVLSARGAEQIEAVSKPGSVLRLRKARVDMYRGSMRLCVVNGDGGAIERADDGAASVPSVDEGNNMSLLEFELVQADNLPFRTVDQVKELAAKAEEAKRKADEGKAAAAGEAAAAGAAAEAAAAEGEEDA